jgi:protein gp37
MSEKTKIEWCTSSWNPVTGCDKGCPYCYARTIAHRFEGFEPRLGGIGEVFKSNKITDTFKTSHGEKLHVFEYEPQKRTKSGKWIKAPYPYGFEPTLHQYALDIPQKWKKPRTIFVGSMADVFGDWVPEEWIKAVFDACASAPQHKYLFLTKNPKRYLELAQKGLLPKGDNFWYGTSTPTSDIEFFEADNYNCFLSIEPLLGDDWQDGEGLRFIKWLIIGAETGNRKDKVIPEASWVKQIVTLAKKQNVQVFMKESLLPIVGEKNMSREFPWE